MKTLFFNLIFAFSALTASAQSADFATLKAQMTNQSIPLINLTVDESALNKDTYIGASIEIVDLETRTEGLATAIYKCNVRYRGATSLVYDKKSFNIKLVDDTDADLNVSLFGIRAENSWILDAMTIDRSRMRNRVCFDIWNEMSKTPYETKYDNRNGTDGLHIELFINGRYHGLYCISDKVDRKLLGLKKAQVDDSAPTTRGILYKCNNWNSASSLKEYADADVNSSEWNAWELQYPNDYADASTWNPLMQLIDFCSDATADATFRSQFNTYFYIDNLVDYYTFANALYVRDTGWKNTFLSVPNITEGHRFLVSPWDMDTSFGGEYDGTYFDETVSLKRFDATAPFNRLRPSNSLGFEDLCRSRWAELSRSLFLPENVNSRLDAVEAKLVESGAWQREVEKWSGNPVELKTSLSDELAYIKNWYQKNYEAINSQQNSATTVSTVVECSDNRNSIFDLQGRKAGYTKDGIVSNKSLQKGIYIIGGKKVKL